MRPLPDSHPTRVTRSATDTPALVLPSAAVTVLKRRSRSRVSILLLSTRHPFCANANTRCQCCCQNKHLLSSCPLLHHRLLSLATTAQLLCCCFPRPAHPFLPKWRRLHLKSSSAVSDRKMSQDSTSLATARNICACLRDVEYAPGWSYAITCIHRHDRITGEMELLP